MVLGESRVFRIRVAHLKSAEVGAELLRFEETVDQRLKIDLTGFQLVRVGFEARDVGRT